MLVPEDGWEPDRRVLIEHLVSLVASGRLDLVDFDDLVAEAHAAVTPEQLAAIVLAAPSPVRLTPEDLRRVEPLAIDVGHGQVKLERRWQLAAETVVNVGHGQAVLDLSKAEWDSPIVDLELVVRHGQIVVTVPDGVRVTFGKLGGNVVDKTRDEVVLPGAPELHIDTEVAHGQIVLRSPKRPRRLVRRLRRIARRSR